VNYVCKICGAQLSRLIEALFDDRHGYVGRFDIYRCEGCGFCQTVPEIPEDKIGEIYTQYYPRKDLIDIEEVKQHPINLLPERKRWWMGVNNTAHYHIKAGTRVLDIGCGDCTSVREIEAMGAEGYGIEPDQNIRPIVEALGLKVHIGLFDEVPYPDKFFDYITMSQVLEHIHHPIKLLSSFQRILKDDGEIILGVPNVDSHLRSKYGRQWLNWHVPYHINHFSRKSLELLAKKSGYWIETIVTITPNLWVDLQKRLARYPVQEGVKVPFFNGEPEPPLDGEAPGRITILVKRYLDSLRARFGHGLFLRILALRLIDRLGKGESYLVFLGKSR